MDFERPPSRPLVKSTLGAQVEWENWLVQNNFEHLRDAEGLDWRVLMSFDQLPSPKDPRKARWITCLHIELNVRVGDLVRTGTFDPVKDARLIEFVGERAIPLRMRKIQYEAESETEMRDILIQALPELRESFGKTPLNEVKRSLVGRWIDSLSVFGQRSVEVP